MLKSPLGYAIGGMIVIGVVTILYWVISAMDTPDTGSLSSYSRGEMSGFGAMDAPPAQPNVVYTIPDDGELRLSDYRGKVILVNFWATWCAPCVEEMPALDRLQGELGGDDFEVVTISLDRSMDDAAAFYERMGLANLPLIHDPSFASMAQTGARGLPLSVLYDRNGMEIGRLPAPAHWDSEDALDLIRAAIRFH